MRRLQMLLIAAALCVVGGRMSAGADFSDAIYVATSTNTATVQAAADWTPPSIALNDPTSPLRGTVTLSATASDAESGITAVDVQYLAPGAGTWTTVCTVTGAPFTCAWNTGQGVDGGYELRARATNGAGYVSLSDPITVTVANKALLVLANPGEIVRGSVPLSTTLYNGGLALWAISIQYAPAGTTSWKTLCSPLSGLFGCTWNTTTVPGDTYDLRAVATSGFTTLTSAVVSDVLVDNTAPTATMVDPGSPLSGTVTLAATVTDGDTGSGVAQVLIEAAPAGGSYRTLCTLTADPYSCRFATTGLADGTYSFRATATDLAGNARTSTAIGSRVVDNTVSSVSVDDPGAYLRGTVSITAQAASTAGIASVRIQRSPTGTGTWSDLCTATAAPYACAWNTTTVADGSYDLRALLVDGRGQTTVSAVVAARRVDNSALRAVDVQTINGGSVGRLDQGDALTLTYSERINPASVLAGWNGAGTQVTLRLRDGNLLGTGAKGDLLDVQRGSAVVPLGSVALREDYIKTKKTATFTATMSATTVTVDGVDRTVITVAVGAQSGGSGLRTAAAPATLVWTPSATVTSLATGRPCSTAPATESGALDRDL